MIIVYSVQFQTHNFRLYSTLKYRIPLSYAPLNTNISKIIR